MIRKNKRLSTEQLQTVIQGNRLVCVILYKKSIIGYIFRRLC